MGGASLALGASGTKPGQTLARPGAGPLRRKEGKALHRWGRGPGEGASAPIKVEVALCRGWCLCAEPHRAATSFFLILSRFWGPPSADLGPLRAPGRLPRFLQTHFGRERKFSDALFAGVEPRRPELCPLLEHWPISLPFAEFFCVGQAWAGVYMWTRSAAGRGLCV